jgi:hypothetical protein
VFTASQCYSRKTQNINTISNSAIGHNPGLVPFTLHPHNQFPKEPKSSFPAMHLEVNLLNVKETKIMKYLFYLTKLRNFPNNTFSCSCKVVACCIGTRHTLNLFGCQLSANKNYGVSYFHHDRQNTIVQT